MASYSMLTVNCDGHSLLGRLHKPDPKLPDDAHDKRSGVPLEPDQWAAWLSVPVSEAAGILVPPAVERFDLADARLTAGMHGALGRVGRAF